MEDSLQLNLEILADHGVALIRCRGQLKFGRESQLLKKCVDSVLSQFSVCVLGLTALHQIDARGLGTLVACVEKARARGCLLLIGGASEKVQELLHITRLTEVLEIYTSESEAMQACGQAA